MFENEMEMHLMYKQTPLLIDWSDLLNFFHTNFNKLTEQQKRALYYKCEWYRNYFNETQHLPVIIQKGNGEVSGVLIKTGLDIQKHNVYPNIYAYYSPDDISADTSTTKEINEEITRVESNLLARQL